MYRSTSLGTWNCLNLAFAKGFVLSICCQELDYTFVGINKEEMDNLQSSLGCKIVPIVMESEPELKEGKLISIFQHPKGRPKEWSVKEILRIEKPFVYYKADTEPGSSGSPVLTSPAMTIVAIHCTGKQKEYNKGTLCSEVIMHLNKGTCTFIVHLCFFVASVFFL